MIFDRIGHSHLYRDLNPRIAAAFDYLARMEPTIEDGVYNLIGDDLIARVQTYQTLGEEEQRWESHRSYIDIQTVQSGEEEILWSPIFRLEEGTGYDAAKDLILYSGAPSEPLRLTLRPGDFAIFFPHDGHKPGIAIGEPAEVRKVVMKAAVW